MKSKMRAPATARMPAAAPTPIPALAPVLRPGDGAGSDGERADGLVAAEVVVPVAAVAEVEDVGVLEVMAGV